MHIDELLRIFSWKRVLACKHFKGRNTQCVYIGALIHWIAFDLLRGHICHCAKGCKILGSDRTRQTKIKYFKPVVLLDENVGRINVPMDDAHFMGIL